MPKRKQRLAKIASLVVEHNKRRKDSRQFETGEAFEYDKRRSRFLGRVNYKSDFVRGTSSDTSGSDGEEEDDDNKRCGEC